MFRRGLERSVKAAKGRGFDGGVDFRARAHAEFRGGRAHDLGDEPLAVAVEFDPDPALEIEDTKSRGSAAGCGR